MNRTEALQAAINGAVIRLDEYSYFYYSSTHTPPFQYINPTEGISEPLCFDSWDENHYYEISSVKKDKAVAQATLAFNAVMGREDIPMDLHPDDNDQLADGISDLMIALRHLCDLASLSYSELTQVAYMTYQRETAVGEQYGG